jgi:hypothetical protein
MGLTLQRISGMASGLLDLPSISTLFGRAPGAEGSAQTKGEALEPLTIKEQRELVPWISCVFLGVPPWAWIPEVSHPKLTVWQEFATAVVSLMVVTNSDLDSILWNVLDSLVAARHMSI